MKRIDIYYGVDHYSVAGRDLDEVMEQIRAGVGSAEPVWMPVNLGEGTLRPASILLTPGVPITVVPEPDPLP